ncbi:hypothetical protein KBD81_05040, partial [Candidatus Woesebacteria bacterium]|nr:hypothetical protein [Candidatus Woesebacteria bacterium]
VNIIHLYECPPRLIVMETGLSIGIVTKAQVKFEENGKMFFFQGYVFLKNARKYETYSGRQNEIAKGKLLNELSKEVLDFYKNKSDTPIDTPLMPSITHNLESKTYKQKLNNIDMSEDVNPEDIPF